MTYRKFAEIVFPEDINPTYIGGVLGCPGDEIEGAPVIHGNCFPGELRKIDGLSTPERCTRCWYREIPERLLPQVEARLAKLEKEVLAE